MEKLIQEATEFLRGKIRTTPVEYSSNLPYPSYLKLECLQLTGSFKIRGAFFYLSKLSAEEKKRGVATVSAGNHGLGIAYAARELNIPCTVFVPKSVDQAKEEKIVKLGAKVIKSDLIGYDDTFAWASKEAEQMQLPMVSAYNDEKIMAGNGGTLAVELLEQIPDADHFVLPMGGGGLAAGFAYHIKSKKPRAKITICQLEACPAFKLSLESGKAFTYMPPCETLAGGLEGGLGDKCFEILKTRVDEIALIKEDELKSAILWLLQYHQYLIEPSAAVTIAAALFNRINPQGKTVILLSGRNVSYATLQSLICSR